MGMHLCYQHFLWPLLLTHINWPSNKGTTLNVILNGIYNGISFKGEKKPKTLLNNISAQRRYYVGSERYTNRILHV